MRTGKHWVFVAVFLLIGGAFYINAQDLIILKDGNMIEAKVMEISSSEIRYRRFDNLNGPMIIIAKDSVLSVKYENGVLDIISASPTRQSGMPAPLQNILNALPAIPIAGNNLKFQFSGDKWTATVNGENFSAGTIELKDTDDGSILTLKQTHIWPGAVGKTAGRVANMIPGGSAVGGALNTAGSIAGAAGAIEASGPEIVLEYKAGPPAKLSFIRSTTTVAAAPSDTQISGGAHPLLAANRFDLDGFNAFAISFTGMWVGDVGDGGGGGGGITITVFEQYKPNTFFSPSYFLSVKVYSLEGWGFSALGAGVLFKHRFPGNRILWNSGASLEFMTFNDYNTKDDSSFLLVGMGIQTGFSFRFNPYTSLDLNGLLKFPFGTVDMERSDNESYVIQNPPPEKKSVWPFTGGIELGLTFWFPYRSRGQR